MVMNVPMFDTYGSSIEHWKVLMRICAAWKVGVHCHQPVLYGNTNEPLAAVLSTDRFAYTVLICCMRTSCSTKGSRYVSVPRCGAANVKPLVTGGPRRAGGNVLN